MAGLMDVNIWKQFATRYAASTCTRGDAPCFRSTDPLTPVTRAYQMSREQRKPRRPRRVCRGTAQPLGPAEGTLDNAALGDAVGGGTQVRVRAWISIPYSGHFCIGLLVL